MATGSLTPALALAYLRELSLDVRAAVVLDEGGEPLAGDAALAEPVRAALAGGGDEDGVRTAAGDGGATLLAAREPGGRAIGAMAGPCAILPLLAHDIRTILGDLSSDDRPQ